MKRNPPPSRKPSQQPSEPRNLRQIALAGGCFWGVQAFLSRIPGVSEAVSGYANGNTENPTYEDVCRRNTGHAEAVLVRYDPGVLSLEKLLRYFLLIIDPTTLNRQGNDVGRQYRTGVYYTDPVDKQIAGAALAEAQKAHRRPVVTEVLPLANFTVAEEYHQDYLEKNPGGYCHVDFSLLDNLQ